MAGQITLMPDEEMTRMIQALAIRWGMPPTRHNQKVLSRCLEREYWREFGMIQIEGLAEHMLSFYSPRPKEKHFSPLEVAINVTIKDATDLEDDDNLEFEIGGMIGNKLFGDDGEKKAENIHKIMQFARFFVRVFVEYCHREVAELQRKKESIRKICQVKVAEIRAAR